jgi:hypothetical protein
MYYVLDKNNVPVKELDVNKWAKSVCDIKKRRVAHTKVGSKVVSTVFLGIDHGFGGGPPVVFETIVFGGKYAESMQRYCTYQGAIEGHEEAVKLVKSVDKRNKNRENQAL